MQLHFGALRNNNTRLFRTIGPDKGFDSIGDFPQALTLRPFPRQSRQTRTSSLELSFTTINPIDNYVFATMIGTFKMEQSQQGSIWKRLVVPRSKGSDGVADESARQSWAAFSFWSYGHRHHDRFMSYRVTNTSVALLQSLGESD